MSLASQIHVDLALCSLSLEFWSFFFPTFSHINRTIPISIPSLRLGSVGLLLLWPQGMERGGHVQIATQAVDVQPALTAIRIQVFQQRFQEKRMTMPAFPALQTGYWGSWTHCHSLTSSTTLTEGKWQSRHSKQIHRDFQGGQSITASHRGKSGN